MNNEDILKMREEGDPFGKLFVTSEEAFELRMNSLKEKEEYYNELDKVNTELKEKIKDIDNQLGIIFRKYEIEKGLTEGEKKFMMKFWEYLSNEIPETFKIPLTKYERKKHISLKMERHKEAIEKLRKERKELCKKC